MRALCVCVRVRACVYTVTAVIGSGLVAEFDRIEKEVCGECSGIAAVLGAMWHAHRLGESSE